MSATINAFPLCWPDGQPRTPCYRRENGQFKGTLDAVREELLDEIDRLVLGKVDRNSNLGVIISTNRKVRRDGGIDCSGSEPADVGVAIYFKRKGKDLCFACDRYDRIWKNLRALHRTIEAMRAIERYGSKELLDRAFTGFQSLPGARAWWMVMDCSPTASPAFIKDRYRELAKKLHPDAGGSTSAFQELVQAYETAQRERGVA